MYKYYREVICDEHMHFASEVAEMFDIRDKETGELNIKFVRDLLLRKQKQLKKERLYYSASKYLTLVFDYETIAKGLRDLFLSYFEVLENVNENETRFEACYILNNKKYNVSFEIKPLKRLLKIYYE